MLRHHVIIGRMPSTIVLLPGLFAGKWIWKEQIPFLTNMGHTIITFSDAFIKSTKKPVSTDDICNWCEDIVLANAPGSVVVVGNSIGGLIAVMLANRHRNKVVGVVASGIPGLSGEINLGLGTKDMVSREFAHKIANKVFFDQKQVVTSEIDLIFEEVRSEHSLLQMTRILRLSRRVDVEALMRELKQRTLLIWGREDLVTPAGPWGSLAANRPGIEYREIADSGHCPMVERAAEFNELTGSFIRSVYIEAEKANVDYR
jgi:2-hydroxy-6-oxonona-2,4-dienedioate hydrolase